MTNLSMTAMSVLVGQLLGLVLMLVLVVVAIRFLLAATRWMNLKTEAIKQDPERERRSAD